MKSKKLGWVVAGVAIMLVTGSAAVMGVAVIGSASKGPSLPAVSYGPVTLPAAEVAGIESGLVSSDPATVANVMAPSIRADYERFKPSAVAPGSILKIDSGGATGIPGSIAVVTATLSGPSPARYEIELTYDSGRWLVAKVQSVQ